MWLLYRVLLVLAHPFVRLRLYWRGRRMPAYRERVGERFGRLPTEIPSGVVWVHAVSAGEVAAAAPLIQRLRHELDPAGPGVLVTTMTPTGSAAVRRLFSETVAHCYAPYDFHGAVQRFVERTRPRALLLIETELWPNLIRATAASGAPVLLLNARLSERSARGYRRVGCLTRDLLRRVDWIGAQFQADADRFIALGAASERVTVTGSLKFEQSLDDAAGADVELIERWLGDRPRWIAGSTHAGEDDVVLAAHRSLLQRHPSAMLLLAPRHPERFDAVARLAGEFRIARMSELTVEGDFAAADAESAQVLLIDSMGVLRDLYAIAQIAFVGGSLVDRGGHNPIEPAAVGVPVLMGPSRFNFGVVVESFVAADCLWEVCDAQSLAQRVRASFEDRHATRAAGERARAVVLDGAGALDRQLARVMSALEGC
ncbi:MAG: lipid IV(A) 3-deoxy-D-manno-octulosonic acid transferase [Pseudomonadota bacterium]